MNVFELFGVISIQNENANKAIKDTAKEAEKARKHLNDSFEKMGSFAVKCGKVIASGMAAGAAAMGALMKVSIGEYAEYEQLVGGVETLFKSSKNKVMNYANEAYKTAGLSANEYMSTVTSFSASLLQGLDGDTERAADIANMAITDMSDNANKMGTSMKSIQDAYQGFAKQNYTLLDNLKLGYGGTQAEMARLINDSGVLGKAITVTADTVNQVPFNKIIEAIHVVQTEMGITGTTAEEASTTISGSFATFKATWMNLLSGLANEDADIGALFAELVSAGETAIRNVFNVLPTLKSNIGTVLTELAGYLDEQMQSTVWPVFQNLFGFPDWSTVKTDITTFWNDVKTPLSNLSTAMSGISGITFDTLMFYLEWFINNGEAVGTALTVIAGGLAAGAAAAHPYVTAIVLLATAIAEFADAQKTIESYEGQLRELGYDVDTSSISYALEAQKKSGKTGLEMLRSLNQSEPTVEVGASLEPNAGDVLQSELDGTSLSVDVKVNPILAPLVNFYKNVGILGDDFGADGSHANGLDYVPFDNYRAILHRGEAVLTANEAKNWRGEQNNSRELASMVASAVRNAVAGIQFNIAMDTGALVGQLAPSMDMLLGSMTSRKGRG